MADNQTQTPTIEGIFFDLDGTLLDTASDFITVINQMLSDDGLPLLPPEDIRRQVSAGSRKIVQTAYNLPSDHPELEDQRLRLLDYYDRHINQSERSSPARLYDGMEELLDTLDSRNITWGVVTNKPEAYTLPLLEQVGLTTRSKVIICPDHVQNTKPDPEALLLASRLTDIPAHQCVYIGDHLRDIEAGRNASMATIAALYGYIAANDTPAEWQANHYVHCAREILPWLNQLQWRMPQETSFDV